MYRTIYTVGRVRNVRVFDVLKEFDLCDPAARKRCIQSEKLHALSHGVIQTLELAQMDPAHPQQFVANIFSVFDWTAWEQTAERLDEHFGSWGFDRIQRVFCSGPTKLCKVQIIVKTGLLW